MKREGGRIKRSFFPQQDEFPTIGEVTLMSGMERRMGGYLISAKDIREKDRSIC